MTSTSRLVGALAGALSLTVVLGGLRRHAGQRAGLPRRTAGHRRGTGRLPDHRGGRRPGRRDGAQRPGRPDQLLAAAVPRRVRRGLQPAGRGLLLRRSRQLRPLAVPGRRDRLRRRRPRTWRGTPSTARRKAGPGSPIRSPTTGRSCRSWPMATGRTCRRWSWRTSSGTPCRAGSGYPNGEASINVETQADCFAGAWTRWVADGNAAHESIRTPELDDLLRGYLELRDPVGHRPRRAGRARLLLRPGLGHPAGLRRAAPPSCRDGFEADRRFTQSEFLSDADLRNGGNASPEATTTLIQTALPEYYGDSFRRRPGRRVQRAHHRGVRGHRAGLRGHGAGDRTPGSAPTPRTPSTTTPPTWPPRRTRRSATTPC